PIIHPSPLPKWEPSLPLELLTVSFSSTLLEKHGPPSSKVASLERIALSLLTIGVITSIEPCPQFRITQDFIGFIDGSHLLFSILFTNTKPDRLVRMMFSRHLPV